MIYDIINAVVYVVLARLFYSAFIEREEHSSFFSMTITFLWIVIVICESQLLEEMVIFRFCAGIVLNTIFALTLYKKNSILRSVSVSILFFVMALSCEIFVVAIHKYFDPTFRIERVMESEISIYMGVISQILESMVVFWIRKVFVKVKTAMVDSKLWIIYTAFPLYSMSLIVVFAYNFDGPISSTERNLFTYVASSLLLINLFIYWFMRQESQKALIVQKNEIEIANARSVVHLYDQITREREILGKREHEYKNTIKALQGLCANNQIDKMREILDVQNTELVSHTNIFETGNRLINTILNTKHVEAREKNILMRFVINDLSDLHIDDRDCIVILSNILNNAIEAAEKCNKKERLISVKAVIDKGQFVFACHNSYVDHIDPEMRSNKKDVIPHGYGMKNIEEAVTRNNGYFYFGKEEDMFVSVVIIPL